ncbi:GTP-binding protein 10 [Aphelenchoides fujianensis]|nr:GTP-binding protein 10 [Aphelenchoides fujianensis]
MRVTAAWLRRFDPSIVRRDVLHLNVRSGAGGLGVPLYNGVGGDGGSVFVRPVRKADFFRLCQQFGRNATLRATGGENASKVKLIGAAGRSVVIDVPLGVECVDSNSRLLLARCTEVDRKYAIARGGKGGCAANKYKGGKGESVRLAIHLKLTTNVGFALVPAKDVKIADYPFTTLQPQVLDVKYELNEGGEEFADDPGDPFSLSIADLPGIIEGASRNRGRGYAFLKHLEHSEIIVMVVDVHGFRLSANPDEKQRSALESVGILNREMENYDEQMPKKTVVLVLNKTDLPDGQAKADELMPQLAAIDWPSRLPEDLRPRLPIRFAAILPLSAQSGDVRQLKAVLRQLHARLHPLEHVEFDEKEAGIEGRQDSHLIPVHTRYKAIYFSFV